MSQQILGGALVALNAFPVTPFRDDGAFDPDAYRRVVGLVCEGGPGAVFTGCGTGEFASLSLDERVAAAEVALDTLEGGVPVLAGWAGADPASRRVLASLRDRGVAGLLLMAPEAWAWDGPGAAEYYRMLLEESGLPGIVYLKATGGRGPGWWAETVDEIGAAGLKDGMGDPDFLAGLLAAGLEPGRVMNGTPTAEWYAPAFAAHGVRGYSSAVLNFAPALARAFRDALDAGDQATVRRLLREFYWPLRQLRGQSPSYAISLVKAGVQARGIPVGRTRPPLGWPDEATLRRIGELTTLADTLVGS